MDEPSLNRLNYLLKTLPKLPDGRIDYTNSKEIFSVTIVVEHEGKILFLKRAQDLHFFPGLWHVVSGFIDDEKPLGEHVFNELKEETGIDRSQIADIKFAAENLVTDPQNDMQWHIHPVLVRLSNRPDIKINWEHTEYRWIYPEDISKYDRIPMVEDNIRLALEQANLV